MGKDLKEKHERLCSIKERAMTLLEMGMNQDVTSIDAKEIGELMDIVKDTEEAIKYAEEACYYHKVSEAMDEADPEEKSRKLNKYIPEYEGKFYTPNYARSRDSRGRYMYTEPDMRMYPMYYSSPTNSISRDSREGRAGMSRRTYMEAREMNADPNTKQEELENYLDELADDVTELISGMDANERTLLKQKLTNLAGTI